MAKKPNYRFEKRQKELTKKAKKDEKLLRRKDGEGAEGEQNEAGDDGEENTVETEPDAEQP